MFIEACLSSAGELVAMLLPQTVQQLLGFLAATGIGVLATGAGGRGQGALQVIG
ncbi:MAG: hypothetical protein IE917_15195, partial [Betaproteobacteria bacterium]|nr:hypothetical protein [Betaproteobacteria bacterium]